MSGPVRRVEALLDGGKVEYWELDGKRHREDGPAFMAYRPDGSVSDEEWYLDGERHRDDGPAYTAYWPNYRQDGTAKLEEWWLYGERLSHEDWLSRTVGARLDRELLR